jgi:transcriptional regulator GlxA family with amidase domain
LQLLQVFIEVFGKELQGQGSRVEATSDAKERLREFINQTPASDLLHMNFSELVRITRCTRRHLSRIFHEVVGMSFRDKHTELRLVRARELLATTESKVVDVALESGFQSLSLFNLMFKRRFGMSPGKWRAKRTGNKVGKLRPATGGKQVGRFRSGRTRVENVL